MKKIIALLIIGLILTGCVKKDKNKIVNPVKITTPDKKRDKGDNNPLKITVEITGKTQNISSRTGTTYPFKISILNQTDSTYGFWLMTCSYYDNFVFNIRGIQFYSEGCDSNFPELIELPSWKEHIIQGEFEVTYLKAIKEQKNLILGLILVAKDDYSNSSDGFIYEKRYLRKGIIWSKPIKYNW